MTISLVDNSPRDEYTLGAGATQQVFTVSFEFFDDTDLSVYVDGVEKTLGTASTTAQYVTADTTATGSDRVVHVSGTDGFIQFGAELTGASGGSKIVITRDIALSRTTDFPTSGPFDVTTLNTELDKFIAISADLKDQASRALQLTDFDAAASLTLPALDDRKGRVLAFNSSSGAVEAGPTITATQTVAAQAADIDAVAGIAANVTTVAGIQANVTTVAGINGNVTTVAGIQANVTAVAGDEADIGTVATNITNVNTVAGIDGNVTTVAGIQANVTTVAGIQANVTTVASNDANVTLVAGNATNINTVAGQATNLQNVTDNLSDIQNASQNAIDASASQVAAAASASAAANSFDDFDDKYLGSKALASDANPTVDNDGDALVAGALYFNQSANEMRVYDGGSWVAASSAGGVSLLEYKYTATANQTTFTGSDDASNTLSYTVANLIVILNGVILENGSDYTATNGSSVVLASGAALNDELNIIAFKSFTTADMVSATNGGAFSGSVQLNGGVIINESGADVDFRIESDGNENMVFVDGGNNTVGIGSNSASNPLTVHGTGGIGASAALRIKDESDQGATFGIQNDGDFIVSAETKDISFLTNDTIRLTILAGGGITFNGDTAAENALDDYEDGIWTPVGSTNTGSNPSFSSESGRYVKIGKLVHVSGSITNINKTGTTGTSQLRVVGLPYTIDNIDAIGSVTWNGITTPYNQVNVQADTSEFLIFYSSNPDADSTRSPVDFQHLVDDVSDMQFSITYHTNQ